jgi:orotate phosphoribosyltransferase
MLSLEESLKILKETSAIIEGHFILSSGLHSSKICSMRSINEQTNQAIKYVSLLQVKLKMN